ncbi:oxidoreductase [Albimonas pacifica]|uniref:Coenzyme F420-reducing hydrogenase, gamma subunit n=1 Tax=Albimonas pacifica TaxID=1114924 RepID=A0A1I3LLB4_9RHOB|nr:oxidoreductase [Albimonas pacifica]SFI85266.1 Coenzyme F420-reducing hydrogenase, gamma subunit [Albimonas pacifica]
MPRPRVAVWKFASCDGCQLTLLDCEDLLPEIFAALDIAYFPEALRTSAAGLPEGAFDLSLVEGSIATAADAARIRDVRDRSRLLVTLGACATAGGIQALRNFAEPGAFAALVYPSPETIDALAASTPIGDHVAVDFELHGCPIAKPQLVETISALLAGRRPTLPGHSVCIDCKARGTTCVSVARGVPCLGPVTRSGCGAICPAYARGCYGCHGPMETPNTAALAASLRALGLERPEIARLFRTFNAAAPAFREESARHDD